MFFPELIKNIKTTDKVLEIGPGGNPHPRSDVLLEKIFNDSGEAKEQRGNAPELLTIKKVVFYEGNVFPFEDNEFDYIICSHVLEHVDNIEQFMSEVFRVSSKGYLEYPTIYYEYLYNFQVHVNFIKFNSNTLYYLKKSETEVYKFKPIQNLFLQSLNKGYSKYVDDLKDVMFEGFEWSNEFHIKKARSISELAPDNVDLPLYTELPQLQSTNGKSSLLGKIFHYIFKRK
ncbi:MAG: class I SAM-dependent methyltransferase [Desulfuromonadaceae bacterium]